MKRVTGRHVPAGRATFRGLRKLHALLMFGLIGLLAACGSVGQLPGNGVSPEILFSGTPEEAGLDTASSASLEGSTVSGDIFVFVRNHQLIDEVRFFLDGADEPVSTQSDAPYGSSLDTGQLPDGTHSVTVVITLAEDATELTGTARFDVQNSDSDADPGDPTDSPSPSPGPQPDPEPTPTPTPTEADYYVSTEGSDSNSGRSADDAFETIQRAVEVVEPGDVVFIRGGVYPINVHFSASGTEEEPITFMSYPGEWAILDGSDETPLESGDRVFVEGSWNIFKNFEVRYSPREGIYLHEGASHNVFENIVSHHNYYSGFQTSGDANSNTFIGVTSHSNLDTESGGEHADGINMQGGGNNLIVNSRFYNNSDDGLDFWASIGNTVIGTMSYDNGGGSSGDGNGFKMGGEGGGGDHTYIGNIAFNNDGKGFDHNASPLASTLYNNTAYANGSFNFDLGSDLPHVAKNNLSFQGDIWVEGEVVSSHNSWDLQIGNPEFLSTDPKSSSFLTPAADSPVIDAGTDVGLEYTGSAPDLGAFEQGQSLAAW